MLNTIICVDDDPVTLMICEMVLLRANFAKKIHKFDNAPEALSFLEDESNRENTDLILLDLNMPVMDGWSFLNEFMLLSAGSTSKTRVAILSSSVNPSDVDRSKNYQPVIEFIRKPMTIDVAEKLKLNEQLKRDEEL